MKKRLTNNLSLKVVALFFSIALWVLVMNTEDPIDERTFSGVVVTVTHEELVTNKGKTYQISDQYKTVTVTVKAQRSVLDKIKSDDIKAVMDFQYPGRIDDTFKVTASVPGQSRIKDIEVNPNAIPVSIDDSSNATYAITPVATGNVQDGHVLNKLTANPGSVVVSGPSKVVNSIDKVVAEVNVNGLTSDTEKKAELILYDANGNKIDPTRLSFNIGEEGVIVKITLLDTKTIDLKIDTSGVVTARGYYVSEASIQPQTLKVAGEKEDLADLSSVEIDASDFAPVGLSEKLVQEIDITEYLPEDVRLDGDTGDTVVVTISVEMYGTKTFEVPYASIYLMNVADGLKPTYDASGIMEIKVRGPEEVLNTLELGQSNVSVNLVTYTAAGSYNVPVQVNLPEGCSLVSENLKLSITLGKQE